MDVIPFPAPKRAADPRSTREIHSAFLRAHAHATAHDWTPETRLVVEGCHRAFLARVAQEVEARIARRRQRVACPARRRGGDRRVVLRIAAGTQPVPRGGAA
jgi:hypothetical protein